MKTTLKKNVRYIAGKKKGGRNHANARGRYIRQ